MAERPSFSRGGGRGGRGEGRRLLVMALLLALVAGMLVASRVVFDQEEPGLGFVVEVTGADVPTPGFHSLEEPQTTVHAALRAAGVEPAGIPDAALSPGTRVVYDNGQVTLQAMSELLVFGLPIDVNAASEEALTAIPGIGPAKARAIVAEREANGPFADVEALERVHGIGPATVEDMRPFVAVGPDG